MDELSNIQYQQKRRDFLRGTVLGLGGIALNSIVGCKQPNKEKVLSIAPTEDINQPIGSPHFMPTAKRVIYLFQNGGPAQMELFDYKPKLVSMHGKEIPPSKRTGFKTSS